MTHLQQLHYAYGKPQATAVMRQSPEDFIVDEQLSFEPDDQGQHVYLLIQKRNLNTNDVALLLAKHANVKSVAVGYAGLKDKFAVTSQWFSVDMAGQVEPDWLSLESNDLQVLQQCRHSRKLKRGSIKSNRFKILLHQVACDTTEMNQRLKKIEVSGVPNYFGEQRFGRGDSNLVQAEKMFMEPSKRIKRHKRSIYLSAVRSYLFNQVLSRRVSDDSWASAIEGDVFMLDGSHSIFCPEVIDDEISLRVEQGDIHPTGPLWGVGDLNSTGSVLVLEQEECDKYPDWCALLEREGLKQSRRALRLPIFMFSWQWDKRDILAMEFSLPSGTYATSVLRELAIL